jgi:hypothetical protein
LPHDWHPTNAHNDREQINKAREAAEALFRPNKQVERTEVPTSSPVAPSQIDSAPRIPRIIAVPSTMSVAEKFVEEAVHPKPKQKRETNKRRAKIPAARHGRVRALASFGMTIEQVAELYGVSVSVIEGVVAAGTDDQSSASSSGNTERSED